MTEPKHSITEAILEGIAECACVIADLTFARPSVYFEVGLAHGLGIPLLLTCRLDHHKGNESDKKVHFDLEQYKISFWTKTADGEFRWPKNMTPKSRLRALLVSHDKWQLAFVEGDSLELIDGIAGTQNEPSGHHPSLFPLKTTAILGDSNKQPPYNQSDHTVARWIIPLDDISLRSHNCCFLLLGCLRHHGGLHSPVANDFVEVLVNDHPVDGFEIRTKPKGQTDYFYKRSYPDIPKMYPFTTCMNLYAWPVPQSHLANVSEARVLVRIDKRTKWDIDYVGPMFGEDEPSR
jgi:hypothetical protein